MVQRKSGKQIKLKSKSKEIFNVPHAALMRRLRIYRFGPATASPKFARFAPRPRVRHEASAMLSPSERPSRPAQKIAVIGAGAVGLCTALHLLRAGHAVEIFDPREPGEGTSLGNAGVVAVSEVLPLGRPSILRQLPRMLADPIGPLVIRWPYLPRIAPWLLRFALASRASEVERIAAALAALLAGSVEAWREIVRGTGAEWRLGANGWIKVYPTAAELARAMPDIARQRAVGVRMDVLDADELRQLEPALAPVFAGATFCPDVCNVDMPLRMMQALATTAARNGALFHKREVRRLEAGEEGPALTDAAGSRVRYDRIVIAAGAWSRRLVRSLGLDVPLDTERGYHVMLETPERRLRHPVSVAAPGYSLVQMEEGVRLTSGVEFAGLEAAADFRRIRRMAEHAAGVLPGLKPRPQSEWLGFRPSMPRSLPVIGPLRRRPEILLAFGHGHLGLTLGPITGRLVAAMIDGRAIPLDVTPFLPAC